MENLVIFLNELNYSDIVVFLLSSQDNIKNKENTYVINYFDYLNSNNLIVLFLLGLFGSLCAFNFCTSSKKNNKKKYILLDQK